MALGLTILVGGVGAYLLTGVALRPVSRLSREIVGIDSDKLSRRLLWQGPADEVKQLADAFDKVLEQLERAFTRQGRFAADAAHELRTPLAILRTNLEVVHSDPAATLADYRDMTTTQERILTRLEQLVSDLLLLTREEQDRNFGEVYLLPLLEEVVADMTPLAQERGVELRLMAESELPEGIITERIEIIDPLPAAAGGGDAAGASVAGDYVQTGEIEVHSDAGPLTIPLYGPQAVAPESDTDARGRVSPLSWSIFTDDLSATCSAGVRFDYSSTTGTSYYTLRWGSGQTSNSKTCSGAQCNYTISTNWSAYYTYTDAQILSPGLVWGASNAYRCN